jgi:hypothetical protein
LAASAANAQSLSTRDLILSRIDLGLTVPLEYTATTSGQRVQSQSPSTASGYLISIGYTKSPWIGAEMNYKFSRFTQNYVYTYYPITYPVAPSYPIALGIDANVKELTWGYLAHTPGTYAGFKPFAGIGLGTTDFVPTPNGGQGLQRQFRATYYWKIGADYNFGNSHFGARVQARQLFYKAPDFGQNYLTSGAHTHTLEPSIGFYARF